jgi:hypothetical protein
MIGVLKQYKDFYASSCGTHLLLMLSVFSRPSGFIMLTNTKALR